MSEPEVVTDPYPIEPRGPVDITVRPPGSKSQTNRALICAALAEGTTELHRPLESDDSRAMRHCLDRLGVSVSDDDTTWVVTGSGGAFDEGPPVLLDARASGTTARFVTALATLVPRTVTVDGTARMRERPIGPLVAALAAAGAGITDRGGLPPVTVSPTRLVGGRIAMDASESSQFLSATLMAAPYALRPMRIDVTGLASPGYVTTTLEVMRHFGIEVGVDGQTYVVPAGRYRAGDLTIEADASAAVYPWAAAAATGGVASVEGIPDSSTQPDLNILGVLAAMGCHIDGHRVTGPDELLPVDVDLSHMPDGAMTVAVLCSLARGTSRLRGLATLRLKETDRIEALVTELAKVGVPAAMDREVMIIDGGGPRSGATIETYDDHRMAMSFSVLGLVTEGVSIADPSCVAKTWPGFFEALARW